MARPPRRPLTDRRISPPVTVERKPKRPYPPLAPPAGPPPPEKPTPPEPPKKKCDRTFRPPPRPEDGARAFDRMMAASRAAQADRTRRLMIANDLAACRDMALTDVRTYMTRRQLDIALYHMGGLTLAEIGAAVGIDRKTVLQHLRVAAVKRFVELVDQARIERVIAGEYGVRAQAKAAAPAVMEHMVEKAGGKKRGGGERHGVAARDADAIRAADLVLTVAGEKVERSEHHHVHELFATMTTEELRRLGDSGEWPERLARTVGALGLGQKERALDVTPKGATP